MKQLPVDTEWIDRWAQPLSTSLLWLAGSYFAGQLIYAWWMGRLSDVAR
jgi:hypothetical protein